MRCEEGNNRPGIWSEQQEGQRGHLLMQEGEVEQVWKGKGNVSLLKTLVTPYVWGFYPHTDLFSNLDTN